MASALGKHIYFIMVLMVVTGSINTLTASWANHLSADGQDGNHHDFDHPIFQSVGMFLGEFMCLLAFFSLAFINRNKPKDPSEENKVARPFPVYIFILPALCDMCATSIMYVGLTLTYPSVFQMLRGSLVIFTGLFSQFFLGKRQKPFEWAGMGLVLVGLGLVGLASVLGKSSGQEASNPLLGDALVVAAQLIAASQMVIEEKFLDGYDIHPLQAVGYEGLFGFVMLVILMVPFYYMPGTAYGDRFENAVDALAQMHSNPNVAAAIVTNMISISFFNFSGLTITKNVSATARTVLDSVRTLVVWGVSLFVGWESFQYLQVIGFPIMLLGTLVYKGIVEIPVNFLRVSPEGDINKPLLQEDGRKGSFAINGTSSQV